MCMEDIRLGRESYTTVRTVSLPNATPVQLFGFSANRIAFLVATSGDIANIGPAELSALGAASIPINGSFATPPFKIEDMGDIITKPWNGAADGIATSVVVIETFLNRQ